MTPDFAPEAYLGLGLIVLGTLAGAWPVRRWPHRRALLLTAGTGVLLALAVVDILPHALDDAQAARLPLWAVPATVLGGYLVLPALGALLVWGGRGAHGLGTAAALCLHRAVEGMTVALVPTAPVIAALVVHSGSEGLALTAMLEARGRRRLAPWLALACLSPLLGGWATKVAPLPASAHALLMALVAGVLLRGATALVRLVRSDGRTAVLVLGLALTVTTLAVLVLS